MADKYGDFGGTPLDDMELDRVAGGFGGHHGPTKCLKVSGTDFEAYSQEESTTCAFFQSSNTSDPRRNCSSCKYAIGVRGVV